RRASTAHTVSWIWWNAISGRITAPTDAAGKIAPAIGTPEARLFFDPQNAITTSSSREKPSRRAPHVVAASIAKRGAALRVSTAARSAGETRRQSPATEAALKAL